MPRSRRRLSGARCIRWTPKPRSRTASSTGSSRRASTSTIRRCRRRWPRWSASPRKRSHSVRPRPASHNRDVSTLVDEGIAELHAGHVDRAQRLFHEAARTRQDAGHAWAWIAHHAADSDDWPTALRATNRAVNSGETPWWTHHIHGVALTRIGRAQEAELSLQRAATAAPESLDVAVAQARAAIAMQDYAAAGRAMTRCEAIDGTAPRT